MEVAVGEHDPKFRKLVDYLRKIPAIAQNETPRFGIGSGELASGGWWVKFGIRLDHGLAWHAVQELGHVLNYLSLSERLPSVFMPVAPPPYMNGGPRQFLSWLIECRSADMTPDQIAEWLHGRLPRPVDDEAQWQPDEPE